MKTIRIAKTSLVCMALGALLPATAATVTWTGGAGDGLWTSGGNWDSDPNPPTTQDNLVFAGNIGLSSNNDFTNPLQNGIGNGLEIQHLTFAAGSGPFELSGNPIDMRNNGGSQALLTQDSDSDVVINNVITSSRRGIRLQGTGTGTVTLAGGYDTTGTANSANWLRADTGQFVVLGLTGADTFVASGGSILGLGGDSTGFNQRIEVREDDTVLRILSSNALGGTGTTLIQTQNTASVQIADGVSTGAGRRFDGSTRMSSDGVGFWAGELVSTGGSANSIFVNDGVVAFTKVDSLFGNRDYRKRGDGTWAFDANTTNTSRKFTVEEGTLLFNATVQMSSASDAVTVFSGATVGGSGALVNTPLVIQDGGAIAPGSYAGSPDQVGTFTVGNLTFQGDAFLDIELGSSDLLLATGNLTFDPAGILTIRLFNPFGVDPTGQDFTVFDFSAANLQTSLPTFELDLSQTPFVGGAVNLVNDTVVISDFGPEAVIPEPGSAFLLGLGALAALVARRQRRT